jgi:hypothetical protein
MERNTGNSGKNLPILPKRTEDYSTPVIDWLNDIQSDNQHS